MSLTQRITQLYRRAQLRLSGDDWLNVNRDGLRWRLNRTHHIDRELMLSGCFEPATTQRIKQLVQPGMKVLDVGANIGYFSLLLARQVGASGHVWAFEPTQAYGQRLREHLQINQLESRVTVVPMALSDHRDQAEISIGEASATLHPLDNAPARGCETIQLRKLDELVDELGIDRVDLVKVDIDGHEPAFLRGAEKTIRKHQPIMIIEFFQGNLDMAGGDVRQLKEQLETLGYRLHSDRTGEPYPSRFDFLRECGNFSNSVNVWAYPIRKFNHTVQSLRQAA